MSIRLVEKPVDRSIPVIEMKDGDIGVITKWTYTSAVGTVVQRYMDILISIGKHSRNSWSSIFPNGNDSCRVRLLEKGEILIIE